MKGRTKKHEIILILRTQDVVMILLNASLSENALERPIKGVLQKLAWCLLRRTLTSNCV